MSPRPAARFRKRAAHAAIRIATAAAALAVLHGCAAPEVKVPRSYLVLLPNDDGTTGKVVYADARGSVELDQSHQAIALHNPAVRYIVDAAQLQRDAEAAVRAQPRPPRTFQLYFELGNTRINKASEALLAQVLVEVRSRPAPDISVIGHTDTVGASSWNETLSLKRAEEVRQLIRTAAAAAVNVDVTSHGERNLLVPTPDNTPEPRNRRVEITIR